jgi:hypothetical protein
LSPFSNITNVTLAGAAAADDVIKPSGLKAKVSVAAAGPAVADGLAHSGGIRSGQAGLIAKLKQVNQAINVVQALEGESSTLNDMLGKIESMVRQGSKNLVVGEKSAQKSALSELVKDMMKGLNAPIYADALNYIEKEQILMYIGKGFSVDMIEGGIVFDVNKMLEDIYKKEAGQENTAKKREDYRRAMGLVKGALEQLMESLSDGINKVGGLGAFTESVKEAVSLSKDVFEQIREDSSMLSNTIDINAGKVKKLLDS